MKTVQVNLRLEPELIHSLQSAADAESLERGTMMRKLLIEALAGWRLEHALKRYQSGDISIGRASEESGRSHWELIELAQARGIAYRIDVDDAIESARAVMNKLRERVAERPAVYRPTDDSDVRPDADSDPEPRASGAPRTPRGPHPPRVGGAANSLPDFLPRAGGVLLVGINPPPPSVARGHYYQGKLGRRLWSRLESIGLLVNPIPGHEDEAFTAEGHGLTDLVKRVTASADELTSEELREGGHALQARVREWNPGLVVFAFKAAAVHALGRHDVTAGPCGEIAGAKAFLLPGPFAPKRDADRVYEELRRLVHRAQR